MAPRVADDATLIEAARKVLREAKTIVSQREMHRKLRGELQDATAGEERIRRLLAVQPFVRLELRARRGPKEKVLNRCPVCGERLERLKNQTLFGGEVTLTLRCPACGYWTGKEKRIPALYIFHYAGARAADQEAPALRESSRPR